MDTPARRLRPTTLTDVARRAGVSLPTASRILNPGVRGGDSGRSQLRERVLAAAEELGYSVNLSAQAMVTGMSNSVAVIVSDVDDFGTSVMVGGLIRAAEARGVSVAVRMSHDDAARELALLRRLRGERHRGVIVATSRTTDAARESSVEAELLVLAEHGARVVIIGDGELPFDHVVIDNAGASRALAESLVDAGAARIAVVAGPDDQLTSRARVSGLLQGLEARGVVVADGELLHTDFSRDGGFTAANRLVDPGRFDVIAAMSDAMAVGVIAGLRGRGIEVPRDVRVAGFDEVPLLMDVLAEFSTVSVPFREFGHQSIELMFAPESAAPRRIELPVRVVPGRAR